MTFLKLVVPTGIESVTQGFSDLCFNFTLTLFLLININEYQSINKMSGSVKIELKGDWYKNFDFAFFIGNLLIVNTIRVVFQDSLKISNL
jgi:hypothetical protein